MATITHIREKLRRLVLMLSSDQQGEVAAAAHAINRTLKSAGCDWHDLAASIAPQTARHQEWSRAKPCDESAGSREWREIRQWCADHGEFLSDRELEFVTSLERWHRPTEKQMRWLLLIEEKVRARQFRS